MAEREHVLMLVSAADAADALMGLARLLGEERDRQAVGVELRRSGVSEVFFGEGDGRIGLHLWKLGRGREADARIARVIAALKER